MATTRMVITGLLEKRSLTALELSRLAGVKEKEVYQHLSHIEKSAKAKGNRLKINPYSCLSCGFRFKDRKRYHPPSRCPVCKEERISNAIFEIV
jgi:predicted Zn-ribbon and HTH transcriptional regulator